LSDFVRFATLPTEHHYPVPQVGTEFVLLWTAVGSEPVGTITGIAREIELYNSAYTLAWKHVSEFQKREKPNIASRLLHCGRENADFGIAGSVRKILEFKLQDNE
jgi:hypothetical protein